MDISGLGERIEELVAAGLVIEESPGELSFRHALMREAVYSNLLVKERKFYHRAIAETIEHIFPDSLEEYLVDLSQHFNQAGIWDKALEYSRRAGERAQAMHAPREAFEHFSRALDAAQHIPQTPPLSPLYRERGRAFEISGEFERARSDQEAALADARKRHDRQMEWQAYLDLSFLWASRNYGQTGQYLEKALELARRMDDPHTLGHTLNRVGNWHLNVEEPEQALRYHQEALSLFQKLDDDHGLAETYDLLGLTSMVGDKWEEGTLYYEKAIALLRAIDDRAGLSSALASYSERGVVDYNDFVVYSSDERRKIVAEAEEALKIARDIGWRSGEAYAMIVLGFLADTRGDYRQALSFSDTALDLTREIGHRQWTVFALIGRSSIYIDLLDLDKAQTAVEEALPLAQEIGSAIFIRQISALLAWILIQCGGAENLDRAQHLVDAVSGEDEREGSFGLRFCVYTRVELDVARGRFDHALTRIDSQLAKWQRYSQRAVAPRLRLSKARALVGLHRFSEAEATLQELVSMLSEHTGSRLLWLAHAELGRVLLLQNRAREAKAEFAAACNIVDQLAATIPDPALRADFQSRAFAAIPADGGTRQRSPRPPAAR